MIKTNPLFFNQDYVFDFDEIEQKRVNELTAKPKNFNANTELFTEGWGVKPHDFQKTGFYK